MRSQRISCIALMALFLLAPSVHAAEARLRLATTTSTENSGLLKVLLPPFEKQNNCRVDVIAVGTGKALKLGEAGDVDVVLLHARPLEDAFVAAGHGVERRDVMYNDFVIIGPAADPARVRPAGSAKDAFRLIARARAPFISRGDKSGTHTREMDMWQEAGLKPSPPWYIEAVRGMGDVITMATEKGAYTLADRATYNAYRKGKTNLIILVQGDPRLYNPYGVIAVNPAKHPAVKYVLAKKFIGYLMGKDGQKIIASYRVNGEPLFRVYGESNK